MSNDIAQRVKQLYAEDANARIFLDKAASRQRDASITSVDRIVGLLGLSRAEAVRLAKKFDDIGCADFIVGRHSAPSRIRWHFSLISLGKIGSGELAELEAVGRDAEPDDDTATSGAGPAPVPPETPDLSLNEAKERLSRSLGVPVANIEIIVKA